MNTGAGDTAAGLRAGVSTQVGRLDYAVLQLTREAKFKKRDRPEDRRFFRAHDVVMEVRQTLEDLFRARVNSQDPHSVRSSNAEAAAAPHRIEVEISPGYPGGLRGDITFKGVCDAEEGAPCRMWCNDPDCREEASWDHDNHVLVDQGECGVIGTLNADPSMIPELYEGPTGPLRSGSIDLEQDIDGVTWRYGDDAPRIEVPAPRPGCAENCRHQCPECHYGLGSHLTCDPRCEHRQPALSQ